jgi:sec-independent protein translocase protein TatA
MIECSQAVLAPLAIGMPNGWEWVVILIIALLIFGGKLPDLARNLGKSLTEFKKGINEYKETKDDVQSKVNDVKKDIVKEVKNAAGFDDSTS